MLGLEDRHDQRQANRYFRRSYSNHEEDDDLSVQMFVGIGKSHKCQVGRIQHQLDRHEDNQRVTANQYAQRPDGKQDRR